MHPALSLFHWIFIQAKLTILESSRYPHGGLDTFADIFIIDTQGTLYLCLYTALTNGS